MGRGGQHKDRESGPERKCLVDGESHPKAELIRFVTGPEGQVVPDIFGKLPGRGYYVRADGDILEQAVAKKVFSRGAKEQVTVPDNLLAEVDRQMVQRVVTLISLARKSGLAIARF